MKRMTEAPGNAPVLTVDGPSGSGKGTVGRIVAERLGWHFLDSGALYRLLAVLSRLMASNTQPTGYALLVQQKKPPLASPR